MDNVEIAKIFYSILKISLLVFVIMHIILLGFVLRRFSIMKKYLSTLRRFPIIYLGVLNFIFLILILIYIISLPTLG